MGYVQKDLPKGSRIKGVLTAYWEQGFEGLILYALHADEPKGIDGPIILEDGQYIKIWKHNDDILWEGEVKLVSRYRFFLFQETHTLPYEVWSDHKQKGFRYKDWIALFYHDPPLKAEITL